VLPLPRSYRPGEYLIKLRPDFTGTSMINLMASIINPNSQVRIYKRSYVVSSVENSHKTDIHSKDGRAVLEIGEKSVFKKTYLWLSPYQDTLVTKAWPEIKKAGPAYTIAPRIVYYDRPVAISIKAPQKEKVGLFTSMGGLGWLFNSSRYDKEKGCYCGRIKENIPFMLFKDTVPPKIKLIIPKKPRGGVKGRKIVFKVRDRGAGIFSDKNIITHLNGKWILNEYDFESHKVKILLRGVNRGKHVLTITARDNLKNETKIDLPFFIRM
jgi:hypothetical protein